MGDRFFYDLNVDEFGPHFTEDELTQIRKASMARWDYWRSVNGKDQTIVSANRTTAKYVYNSVTFYIATLTMQYVCGILIHSTIII